jgi:Mg2+ and Co2+ transporter CorA
VFNIHPLAVEDAQEFDQSPKVEDYEDFVYLVAYGSLGLDRPFAEVHCFYSYRDLLSGSLDAYMSVVSNRLNDVMKQLTIIATVFLPLSFLPGFFGQNLGWLVNREGSLTAFLIFGTGTEALAVVGLLFLFRRRGWM